MQNCPEALQILPLHVIHTQPRWKKTVCEVLERGETTVTSFDYEVECFSEPAGVGGQEEKKRKRWRKLMRKMRKKAKRAQEEEDADIANTLGRVRGGGMR